MRDTSKATDKNSNPGTQYIYCADNSLSITKTLSWPPKAWASPKHRADLRNRNNTSLGSQPMEVWFQFPPSKLPKMPGTNNPNPPSSSSRPLKVRMQQTWMLRAKLPELQFTYFTVRIKAWSWNLEGNFILCPLVQFLSDKIGFSHVQIGFNNLLSQLS